MLTIYLNNMHTNFNYGVVYYIKVISKTEKMNFISIKSKKIVNPK